MPDIENLQGSDHDDVLAGDFRNNFLSGLAGDDLLYGGPDGGHDFMFGGYGDDQVYGGKGYDWLFGGHGDDLLKGGPGNDTLELELEQVDEERSDEFATHYKKVRYDYGDDRLEGGAGDDSFFFYPDGGDDWFSMPANPRRWPDGSHADTGSGRTMHNSLLLLND